MAQIGSFVPAEYAVFPVIHNVFARVSTDDNIEASLSTFSVEMRDMAFILKTVDGRSLVVLDELGRGTSTRDGLAIAFAMSEALIESRASVWFATHFVELTRFFRNCSNVLNLHLESDMLTTVDGTPQLIMRYKATAGTVDPEQHYGINLARAMGFPASVIQKAEEVANGLRQKREASQRSSESNKAMLQRKVMTSLYEALKQALISGSEDALPGYLAHLQKEFILRMAEIDEM
ncbi:MutS protein -like protein 4 [Escovopsis weberi]|uniref:MutS protein-like protein 4 n=1 Tax=Escovopsis weberi TaxID=150374 RepID=A0A0M8N6G5_ESCWE|nr:MutS protein -like protein 4 [Escovopsis weberi]